MIEEIITEIRSTGINRDAIRADISQMSFEDLKKLKENIGSKVYNEVLSVQSRQRTQINTNFKRVNKNRPREMSSKMSIQHSSFRKCEINSVNKNMPRDPRFDPLCGNFNEKIFRKTYKFMDDIKQNERAMLQKEVETVSNPKQQKKIKYLIQRLDNQIQEKIKKDEENSNSNEKPSVYQRKSEKKIMNLLNHYEGLKQSRKLQKHITKKSKKVSK